MVKWNCYIQEYNTEKGLSARLRDKKTNKKIVIETMFIDGKYHLLQFLSAAKSNINIMPTIYNRDGIDVVEVRGIKEKEDNESIFVNINIDGGGYSFK